MLLPKPDDLHTLITIGLDPPLRQGQTRYPFLVMQFKREEEVAIELNMTEYAHSRLRPRKVYPLILGQRNAGGQVQGQVDASIRAASAFSRCPSLPWVSREESRYTVQGLFKSSSTIRRQMQYQSERRPPLLPRQELHVRTETSYIHFLRHHIRHRYVSSWWRRVSEPDI